MQEYSDDEILELLRSLQQEKRNEALSYLYRKLYGGIAQFILTNSGTAEDVKDLFQDSLIVFYEHALRDDFVRTSSIKTYVHAVCRNLWYKRLRKASNREISTEDLQQFGIMEEPVDLLESEEKSGKVADLMEQLGKSCRKILLLFYYEEKSMKEIADLLGLADANVAKNKKARCMKKMRELFTRSGILRDKL